MAVYDFFSLSFQDTNNYPQPLSDSKQQQKSSRSRQLVMDTIVDARGQRNRVKSGMSLSGTRKTTLREPEEFGPQLDKSVVNHCRSRGPRWLVLTIDGPVRIKRQLDEVDNRDMQNTRSLLDLDMDLITNDIKQTHTYPIPHRNHQKHDSNNVKKQLLKDRKVLVAPKVRSVPWVEENFAQHLEPNLKSIRSRRLPTHSADFSGVERNLHKHDWCELIRVGMASFISSLLQNALNTHYAIFKENVHNVTDDELELVNKCFDWSKVKYNQDLLVRLLLPDENDTPQ
ncbi:hypothetical protein LTR93_002142 [Exophiala xenobiotica]|nr:hypothetical protein LTR93_002142 [Exophiala xenobiotica]KAK5408367.1 hypothetical protein LTR06_007210 [Exophiala xenobiotica]